MKIAHVVRNQIELFTFTGDLDVYSAPKLREHLVEQRHTDHIILDLSRVAFVDSTALAVLVQALRDCRETGGDLCLCGLQDAVQTILHLTQLERIFTIAPDVEAAVRQYRAKA